MKKLAVVALGGNALLRDNQLGTIDEQEQNTSDTLENLIFLVREGYDLVITHGNGPQVGNILMRNDAGEEIYGIPQMPLDICVADSQGGIGYMIERMLRNILHKNGISREVVTLITMALVKNDDPAFQAPSKRVGKTYSKEEADRISAEKGWIFQEGKKREGGFRRAVPSPRPMGIINEKVVETLARQGTIVIAAGGEGCRCTGMPRVASGRQKLSLTRIWHRPCWQQGSEPMNSTFLPMFPMYISTTGRPGRKSRNSWTTKLR